MDAGELIAGICFLARPLVLDPARVKENCFSLSFIAAPSCQTWRRAPTSKFCRVSRGVRPPQGRIGGRCGWKLRSRETGLDLTHARKVRRQAEPPSRPAKGRPSVGQHVFVIGQLKRGADRPRSPPAATPSPACSFTTAQHCWVQTPPRHTPSLGAVSVGLCQSPHTTVGLSLETWKLTSD
jgi:hypothetical protein